jgi:hypothetical protein
MGPRTTGNLPILLSLEQFGVGIGFQVILMRWNETDFDRLSIEDELRSCGERYVFEPG